MSVFKRYSFTHSRRWAHCIVNNVQRRSIVCKFGALVFRKQGAIIFRIHFLLILLPVFVDSLLIHLAKLEIIHIIQLPFALMNTYSHSVFIGLCLLLLITSRFRTAHTHACLSLVVIHYRWVRCFGGAFLAIDKLTFNTCIFILEESEWFLAIQVAALLLLSFHHSLIFLLDFSLTFLVIAIFNVYIWSASSIF